MTRDQIVSDIYIRLTSRKLWLAILSVGFAYWSFHNGDLTAQQFQQAVMVAVTAYTAAEGASDFAAALRPKRSPDAVVNVDASPATAAPTELPAATTRPKRVRPSRAKVKVS